MDAVDNLGDAIDVTRELLLPIRPWLWLKLAIVVLFVAGLGFGGGLPTDPTIVSEFDDPGVEEPTPEEPFPTDPAVEEPAEPELTEDDLLMIGAVVVGIVLLLIGLWFLFALLGGIAEFVFIESLRSQEVYIWQYTKENFWRGVRLFGFRLVIGLLTLLTVALPALLAFVAIDSPEGLIGIFAFLILLWLVVGLVQAIVNRFTSEFVAPVMLLESRGVLSGWRRFWPTLRSNWKEYVVYLLLVWILQLVINIAAAFIIGFGLIVLAIPVFILIVLLLLLGTVGAILAIPVVVLAVLLALLIVALVQMPIRTYFQYYALLLLGDTNADLDLIPEQRGAIRAGAGVGPDAGNGPVAPGSTDAPDVAGEATDTDEPSVWDRREGGRDDREGARGDEPIWGDRTDSWGDSDDDVDRETDRRDDGPADEDDADDENDRWDEGSDDEDDDRRGW